MLKSLKGSLLAVALGAATLATPASAFQVTGVAFASHLSGNPQEGFIGPWRGTATGMDIAYAVLCYDTTQTPRQKRGGEAIASIPDGATLGDIRTISTTAIVNLCAEQGITVNRGAVVLPQVILGQ